MMGNLNGKEIWDLESWNIKLSIEYCSSKVKERSRAEGKKGKEKKERKEKTRHKEFQIIYLVFIIYIKRITFYVKIYGFNGSRLRIPK